MSAGDELACRARRGVVWSTVSYGATKALGLATTVALARLLAPGELGVLAAVLVYAAFVELASDLGLKAVVVYEQEEGVTARVQTAFTANLALAAFVAAAGALAAPAFTAALGMADRTGLFRLAVLSVPLAALGNVADGLLLRELRFQRRVLPEVARTLVRGGAQVGLAVAGLGAAGLVIGLLAGTAVWSAALWAVTGFRPTLQLDRGVLRGMARYGAAAAALEVFAVISTRADVFVVGSVLGASALGLYAVAFRVPELVIETVAWQVSAVAFPALAQARAQADGDDRLGQMTLDFLRFQALYALPLAATLAVLAGPVTVALFGEAWRPAGGVLAAVAVACAIGAVMFPLGDALKATGHQRALVVLNVVQLPLLVAAIVVAAPAGIVAVAWTRAGTRLLFGCALARVGAPAAGLPMRSVAAAFAPGLVAAAGAAGAAGALRLAWDGGGYAVIATAGVAAAAGALAALRLIAPAALDDVRGLVRRVPASRPKVVAI